MSNGTITESGSKLYRIRQMLTWPCMRRKSQGAGVRHEEPASLLDAVPAAIPECHESASAVADPVAAAPPDDADRQVNGNTNAVYKFIGSTS